jgi:hypothetical protein
MKMMSPAASINNNNRSSMSTRLLLNDHELATTTPVNKKIRVLPEVVEKENDHKNNTLNNTIQSKSTKDYLTMSSSSWTLEKQRPSVVVSTIRNNIQRCIQQYDKVDHDTKYHAQILDCMNRLMSYGNILVKEYDNSDEFVNRFVTGGGMTMLRLYLCWTEKKKQTFVIVSCYSRRGLVVAAVDLSS